MRVQKIRKGKISKLNKNGKVYFEKDLQNLNTFKVSGKTKVYLEINTIENLIDVLDYLQNINSKIFILGGGSNILICEYFDGAVIKLGGDFSKIENFNGTIEMGAGVKMIEALNFCIEQGWGGMEESIGIPGTIGGATYMNASCYNFEMKKIVKYVVAFDLNKNKISFFSNEDCMFDYRKSIFQKDKYIILRVGFSLEKKDKDEMEKIKLETLKKRISSQPKGHSAGSVFKKIGNLNVSKMLDDMKIKGRKIGGAKVSEKHANFIINENNATQSDIKNLINDIQIEFEKTYGICLEREIKYME